MHMFASSIIRRKGAGDAGSHLKYFLSQFIQLLKLAFVCAFFCPLALRADAVHAHICYIAGITWFPPQAVAMQSNNNKKNMHTTRAPT